MSLTPEQKHLIDAERRYLRAYPTAETYVQALLRKKHPLLSSQPPQAPELAAMRREAERMLKQARSGKLSPECREFLGAFYAARNLGRIPFNFILPPIPNARRERARQLLQGRVILGAIFSTFPSWNGRLPPWETLQWYWLTQAWEVAQRMKPSQLSRDLMSGLAACVGWLIGLNECFERGYAAELAHGGVGAALLRFDLFHASNEQAYRRVYRRLTWRRMPSLAERSGRAQAHRGRADQRVDRLDKLISDVGLVASEWLGRPIEEMLTEFDRLRFVPKRLHDRVRDLRRHEMAQKRGTKVPHVSISDPVADGLTVEDTLADPALGRRPSDVESRITDPIFAEQWVKAVTARWGKTAGGIAAVLVEPGSRIQEIGQETGRDRKTIRKYLPKLAAHLREFQTQVDPARLAAR